MEVTTKCPDGAGNTSGRGQYLVRGTDMASLPQHAQSSIFDDKICRRCKLPKSRLEFGYVKYNRDSLDSYCRPCRSQVSGEAQKRKPEQRRIRVYTRILKSKYGLTREQHAAMVAAQDGKCAICHQVPTHKKGLVVDHDHATGKVRALLCAHCNTALGLFDDDPAHLRAAADYLDQHKGSE